MYHVDGNCNKVHVGPVLPLKHGKYQVVRLADDLTTGYIVDASDAAGGFGDSDCPSSYRRPCLTWFGKGERFQTAAAALASISKRP